MQDLVLLNVGLLDGLPGVAGIIFMIVIIDHSPIPQKKAPLSLLVGGAITILKIICVYIYMYNIVLAGG